MNAWNVKNKKARACRGELENRNMMCLSPMMMPFPPRKKRSRFKLVRRTDPRPRKGGCGGSGVMAVSGLGG